jgi:FG-GAP repeat
MLAGYQEAREGFHMRGFRLASSSMLVVGPISLLAITSAPALAASVIGSQTAKYSSCSCDYAGAAVAVSGSTLLVGEPAIDDASGRVYVYTQSGGSWNETATLVGSDTASGDTFGFSVSLSGTTAIIGAPGHSAGGNYAGSAYVFTQTGATWTQAAELHGSDNAAGDWFGSAVAVDGTNVVVGAPAHAGKVGSAYVFSDGGGTWAQTAELKGSVALGYFGYAVGISGTTAIVGAPGDPSKTGHAFMFTNTGVTWSQTTTLSGVGSGVHDFGSAVAVDGTVAAVGAWSNTGAAYLYNQSGGAWVQIALPAAAGLGSAVAISGTTVVVGSVGASGNNGRAYVYTSSGTQTASLVPSGKEAGDFFTNRAVDISGTTLIVGAPNHGSVGDAFVFNNTSGTTWQQVADLANSDSNNGDITGSAVAISSVSAVAGAPAHDGMGRAYLFPKPPPWHPVIGLEAANTTTGDNFGASLSMTGTTVLAGAPDHAGMGSAYIFAETLNAPYTQAAVRAPGSNYVYERPAELKGSDTSSGDHFGASVSIAGTFAVVGAPGHGGSGSVYVFSETGSTWSQVAELTGSDTATGDNFGASVSISGTTVVVGAPKHGGAGRAYIFGESGSTWSQVAELTGADTATGDNFGASVSISGTAVVVGAPGHGGAGRAYMFGESGGTWTQAAEVAGSDTVAGDNFGAAVGISGTVAVIGAPAHGGSGSAYLFSQQLGGSWTQAAELHEGSGSAAGDHFGAAVAISGLAAIVGGPGHAGTGCAEVFSA